MPWTTHTTQDNTMTVSSSWANTYVKANQEYLLGGRPTASKTIQTTYSSTSNTFVDIDAVNAILTPTISGSRVMCSAMLYIFASNIANNQASVDWIVDSTTRAGNATFGLASVSQNAGSWVNIVGFFTGLSAGSHTFKLQWKSSVATGSVTNQMGAITPAENLISMAVWEF